ncbi:MAG: NADH-quinone oxidoreductase subunit D [Bacteroidia bacterium]|jgi:NADH-quinone oxidoreductase subunit D/NADH-quinone oxidoreductase subunit C/D
MSLLGEDILTEEGEFIINMGPQHPSTHGVLHLKLWLNGEEIKRVQPHLGYIHRSIEKMSESLSYRNFIFATSRMDYLSAHMNNEACALTVEKGLGIEIPERAQVIRILMSELTRLASHQLWWGSTGLDLGAVTPFFYAFREREAIMGIMEETCGARLTQNYNVPGGVMADIHPNFQKHTKEVMQQIKSKLDEYDDLLSGNVIFEARTKGVGVLSKEDAISYGVTGPTARGSGVSCDVRKWAPYSGYEKVQFNEILEEGGDSYARYMVRMREMKESISIIEQLIDNIPDGDFQAKTKNVIKLPKGEFFQRVETARGELGVYIVSDGAASPYRVKYRSPNFSNLFALPIMAKGGKIGDLVAIMSTLDLVIPDIDR